MAAIANDLLELLADPETHQPLTLASDSELAALKRAVEQGKAKRHDGKGLALGFDAALLCQDKRVAYLIEGGIPNLLIDERLELTEAL
jgi:uncharacterized protein YbaR (Trm112 family)